MKSPNWKLWQRLPNAGAIASALKDIPAHWALTPLRDKQPYRSNWQSEAPLPHAEIATLLLKGEEKPKKQGFGTYRAFISGYGLRTGDISRGLLAIDVDGASASKLLEAVSSGQLPQTVSWTSNKPGRRQLLYQVPEDVREHLLDFNHKALREWGTLTSDCDLDFRYNNCQSVLPPSRHPDTGQYSWINSTADCAVALAPQWLCELLLNLATQEKQQALSRQRETEASLTAASLRRQQQSNYGGTAPLELFLSRDDQQLISSGAGQGQRDNKGFKLAANLTATSDRLHTLDIPYDGNPEQLFEEYAARCSPPLPSRDISRIWKSASKKSTPSLSDDQLEKRYSYWQWEQAGRPRHDEAQEPDPQEYAAYCQLAAEEELAAETEAAERTAAWSDPEQQAIRDRNRWRNAKRYTPTHTINQQYFDWEVPQTNTLLGVNSGLGSGKTEFTKRVITALPDEKILALGYRNTLLIQSVERWKNGFHHLHNDNAYLFTADPHYRLALCVDSLMRFKDEDFNNVTVIIDEVMSVINHILTSSTLFWRRDLILAKFTQALRRAKRIIILDGHLADWAVNYINELAGGREVVKVLNLHKGDPLKVIFNTGTLIDTPNGEQLCSNDRSAFVKRIQESECSVTCTDSQTEAETLDEILSNLDLDTFRLDGKTSDKDYAKKFISNPDEYLAKHKIDSLLYTGTAESGLDISIRNYFTEQYCIFFGVVGVDACLQQMARPRDPNIIRHVWAREFSINDNDNFKSYQPKQLERTLTAYHHLVTEQLTTGVDNTEAQKALFHDLINNSHDAHEKAWQVLKSISNYERANFRSCLLERLQDKYGDNVRVITSDRSEEDATLYKDQREEVKKLECSQIFNGEDIDPSAARQINASFGASWEERCKAIKAVYLEMLPGIREATKLDDKGAEVPVWSVDFIYRIRKRDRNFVKACQLAWLLEHPEVAKLQDQVHWARLISTRDKTFLPDHKSRYAQVQALQELGILEFIKAENLEKRYTSDSPEIIALVERGKNKRLATALGVSPGKQPGVKYLGRVLGLLGICTASKAIKDGETVIREYWVESRSLTDPDRAAVMRCLCKKWERYQNGEVEIPKFISFQQLKDLEEMEPKSAPESPTVQGFDPVADTTINVYKLEPSATLEAQTPTTVVAPQERSLNGEVEIPTVEPLVTQNEAVELEQISEPESQTVQDVDPVAYTTGCLYKLEVPATTQNEQADSGEARHEGRLKVGDRIRVKLPGYIPDGLEGVVLAVQPNDKFPLLISLAAPPELPWLREYRAKAEWLEVVA